MADVAPPATFGSLIRRLVRIRVQAAGGPITRFSRSSRWAARTRIVTANVVWGRSPPAGQLSSGSEAPMSWLVSSRPRWG